MSGIPMAWQILTGRFDEPPTYTRPQKEKAKIRLAEIEAMNLKWSDIELKQEREHLKAIINS